MKSLHIAIPLSCLVLSACGGGSSSDVVNLSSAAPGSVALKAGESVQASSFEELKALDLDSSGVGSKVAVTSGPLEGLEFVIAQPISDHTVMSVDGAESGTEIVKEIVISDDMTLWLKGQINLLEVEPNEGDRDLMVDGNYYFLPYSEKNLGTTSKVEEAIIAESGSSEVSGQVQYISIGGNSTVGFGYFRKAQDAYGDMPTAPASFSGVTILYSKEDTYQSKSTLVSLDFEDLSGEFSADSFELIDGSTEMVINVASPLSLNASDGTFSGANGSVKAGSTTTSIDIVGALTTDNNAAAGAIVGNLDLNAGEIIGGIFAVQK